MIESGIFLQLPQSKRQANYGLSRGSMVNIRFSNTAYLSYPLRVPTFSMATSTHAFATSVPSRAHDEAPADSCGGLSPIFLASGRCDSFVTSFGEVFVQMDTIIMESNRRHQPFFLSAADYRRMGGSLPKFSSQAKPL